MVYGFEQLCMMVHAGRVGSTVVASRLTSLPIIAAGEIFNPIVNGVPDWPKQYSYIDFFRRMLSESRERGSYYIKLDKEKIESCTTYLFEYKPYHPGCGENISLAISKFSDAGVNKFIFLHRKNYLRRYVSYLVALKNGKWESLAPVNVPERIHIDINCCSDYEIGVKVPCTLTQLIDHYYNVFVPSIENAICSKDHLILSYEDHVQRDPNITFSKIKEFLEIRQPASPFDAGYQKQNDFPLKEIIENYDEVAEVVASHGYGHLLD